MQPIFCMEESIGKKRKKPSKVVRKSEYGLANKEKVPTIRTMQPTKIETWSDLCAFKGFLVTGIQDTESKNTWYGYVNGKSPCYLHNVVNMRRGSYVDPIIVALVISPEHIKDYDLSMRLLSVEEINQINGNEKLKRGIKANLPRKCTMDCMLEKHSNYLEKYVNTSDTVSNDAQVAIFDYII